MNLKLQMLMLTAFTGCLFTGFGCVPARQKSAHVPTSAEFPEVMVGTWLYQFGLENNQRWMITFNPDGTITTIYHYVFGPMTTKEGGIYKEGPDPNTYMVATLGPLDASYDPALNVIKAEIVIDDYEMKFVEGSLKGRIIDNLIGPVSQDGKTWEVEWRSYSWLQGAAEPPIKDIDEHPQRITFVKTESQLLHQ